MTLSVPTVEEFNAISSQFELLAEWANEWGVGFLPFTSQWQNLGAQIGWSVRVLAQNDGSLQFQAAFQEQVLVDLLSGTGATKVWNSVETRIDMEGTSVTATTDENGILREDIFDGDKRVAIRYKDLGDVMPWTEVTNLYDQLGQRIEKITNLDDGRQRQDLFEDGIRTTTVFTDFSDDNDFGWDKITSEYNSSGQRVSKTTIYDDGSERIETFSNGVRTLVSRTDAGTETWDTIETSYTPFGDLDGRTVTFDNGIQRIERFFENELISVFQADLENAENWFSIDRTYDTEGYVDRSETIFDDGDTTIMFYTGGLRETRVELDGDGDEPWLYRVTHYDDEGVSAVTTYFDGDEFDFEGFGAGGDAPPPEGPLDDLPPILPDLGDSDFLV